MRVLINVGYNYLLLGSNSNVGAILDALTGAHVVREVGYGPQAHYEIEADTRVDVKLISDDAFALPENRESGLAAEYAKLSKENAELSSKLYAVEQKLKKFDAINKDAKE